MNTTSGTTVATHWQVVDMEREIRNWLTERRFCLILEPTDIPEALWICSIFRFKPKGRHGKARPLKRQREGYWNRAEFHISAEGDTAQSAVFAAYWKLKHYMETGDVL